MGSYSDRTTPGFANTSSSSMKSRFTISAITSRGVKCSPAVSFESSANLRISSSNTAPICALLTAFGCRSMFANFSVTRYSKPHLVSRSIWVWKSKLSKISRTVGENTCR